MSDLEQRYTAALEITQAAAQKALHHFTHRDALNIESKGAQDWVSNADRDVEQQIREAINARFPDDSIVGEEHGNQVGSTTYTWVIDPIDGTSSFVNGIPSWCVVIAGVSAGKTVFGVIVDPVTGETFSACDGFDVSLNGKPIQISNAKSLTDGSVAVGHSTRLDSRMTVRFFEQFLAQGGIYHCNGSGALMLAYVASGRLIAYVEPHMYAWDCLAGLYLIERAGGIVQPFDLGAMLQAGGRVVAAAPEVYPTIVSMTDSAYTEI